MKKIVILSASLLLSVTFVFAQKNNSSNYTNAIGLKFYPTGITFKHFFNEKNSGELIGYFYNYGTRITGLYEINFDISAVDGLGWYVGPGAHIGFYNDKHGGASVLGIDGVIGLDYKINSAPINLSVDWQPSIEFGNGYNNGFSGNWGGIAIRYTLN